MNCRKCERCGALFARPRKYSHAQWAAKRFCSRKCGIWNSGLTKESDERLARISESAKVTGLGRPAWNKGLTKDADPRLAAIAEKLSAAQVGKSINDAQRAGLDAGRRWFRGRTKESCPTVARRAALLSIKYAGRKNPEHGERMRALYARRPELHPNSIIGRKTKGKGFTALERAVADHLDALGVAYLFNARVGTKWPDFRVDAANLIVEADGARWHTDKEAERARDEYLQARGWRVLHLAEAVIKKDPAGCRDLLRKALADGNFLLPQLAAVR